MRLVLAIVLFAASFASTSSQDVVRRRPFDKDKTPLRVRLELASPETRVDAKTGKAVPNDLNPEIVLLDERSGRYGFRWIGDDGQRKQVVYQRPDRIDAVVAASAHGDGSRYRYEYRVQVLPSSVQHLTTFWVQIFSRDARVVNGGNLLLFTPDASNLTPQAPNSRWFAYSPRRPGPGPGGEGLFELGSASPPGLVECRISGTTGAITGMGDLPPELAAALPGYDAWPRAYTIGPSDELKTLDPATRVQRLLKWLPEFERLGWMTSTTRQRYERTVQERGVAPLLPLLESDVAARQITSEVVAIVQGLAAR